MPLSSYEQETIINFNKEEKIAYIFTYEKTWQKHLEKKLGLKPVMTNSSGSKEYQIDKKRIPMPRTPRKLSAEARKQMGDRLRKSNLRRKTPLITVNQKDKTSSKGKSIGRSLE